jgi:hypothetical protein
MDTERAARADLAGCTAGFRLVLGLEGPGQGIGGHKEKVGAQVLGTPGPSSPGCRPSPCRSGPRRTGGPRTRGTRPTDWTAHTSRCTRELGKRVGDRAYVAEELIAEIGAAFVCADLGITPQVREDHAQYLGHWLSVLKSDSRAICTAATHAQRAADHLHGPATDAGALAARSCAAARAGDRLATSRTLIQITGYDCTKGLLRRSFLLGAIRCISAVYSNCTLETEAPGPLLRRLRRLENCCFCLGLSHPPTKPVRRLHEQLRLYEIALDLVAAKQPRPDTVLSLRLQKAVDDHIGHSVSILQERQLEPRTC